MSTTTTFEETLAAVRAQVKPETLAAREVKPRTAENYMPSSTAVRSKRWRDKKRYLGNPYRVAVGQIWRRVNKERVEKLFEVLEVGTTHALVSSGLRTTRVRLDRFRPEYQGYERVEFKSRTNTKESK